MLDPMCDEWPADFQTADQNEFLEAVWNSQCCDVFIDEAGESIGQYNKTMMALATRGRHWGHNCYFICQRSAMVSPTVRNQCTRLFAFNQAKDDAQTLMADWGFEELLELPKMPQYEYFYAQRFREIVRGKTQP